MSNEVWASDQLERLSWPTGDVPPDMRVGDKVTMLAGVSDSKCGTVEAVHATGRAMVLEVSEDKSTLLNGAGTNEPDALKFSPGGFVGHTSGKQRYSYERQPDGPRKRYSWRAKVRRFVEVGAPMHATHRWLLHKSGWTFYDFNF